MILFSFSQWCYGNVFWYNDIIWYTGFYSLFCFAAVYRLFTSSRKWTAMETGRYQRLKFWKIKRHSWTAKWQTMADSCMYHMMNCNYMFLFVVEFRHLLLCRFCLFPMLYIDISGGIHVSPCRGMTLSVSLQYRQQETNVVNTCPKAGSTFCEWQQNMNIRSRMQKQGCYIGLHNIARPSCCFFPVILKHILWVFKPTVND